MRRSTERAQLGFRGDTACRRAVGGVPQCSLLDMAISNRVVFTLGSALSRSSGERLARAHSCSQRQRWARDTALAGALPAGGENSVGQMASNGSNTTESGRVSHRGFLATRGSDTTYAAHWPSSRSLRCSALASQLHALSRGFDVFGV